jgi:lipopolysaccharide export system protein LptA
MLKLFINHFLKAGIVSVMLFSGTSIAGKDDFNQEIKIASSNQSVDGIAKKSNFWGAVVIQQGSLRVKADEVEVDASQGDGKQIFIAKGKPAEYSQQQEDGSIVTARANRIEYRLDSRSLSLDGSAEIQQNNSSVKGESIIFNMELEQILAQGENNEEGRVVTIFQPEKKKNNDQKNLNKQEKQP